MLHRVPRRSLLSRLVPSPGAARLPHLTAVAAVGAFATVSLSGAVTDVLEPDVAGSAARAAFVVPTGPSPSALAADPRANPAKAGAAEAARLAAASRRIDVAAGAKVAAQRRALAAQRHKAAAQKAAAQKAAAQQAAAQQAAAQRRVVAARASRDLQRVRLAASDPRTVALALAGARGWDSSQFGCLDSLWQKESGWQAQADNPTSSAFGIPQALPGSRMASEGSDWRTNPATQIRWGLRYISDRYGSPCAAWAHSRATNWY